MEIERSNAIEYTDPSASARLKAALGGWWKIECGGRTEYYYIFKNGRACYTLRAPQSNAALHIGEGASYWFERASDRVTFIREKTGTIEDWSPAGTARAFRITADGVAGRATKLF